MVEIKEYCGWKYMHNKETAQYFIEPNEKKECPKTFFKYYSLSKNSVEALTNAYIYVSHPSQLNDPFDCNKNMIKISTNDSIKALWEHLYSELVEKFDNDLEAMLHYSQEAFMNVLYVKMGIVSLTTTNSNMLMWSHYANHKGFCVEWDIKKLGFNYHGPFPIHYTNEIKSFDIEEYGGSLSMLIQSNVKSKVWEYENEWRLLALPPKFRDFIFVGSNAEVFKYPDNHNRKLAYSLSAIKSVTLGGRFFHDNIYKISDREYEIVYNSKFDLDYQIIDFLSNPKLSYIDIYRVTDKNLSDIETCKVTIYKINEYKFRMFLLTSL